MGSECVKRLVDDAASDEWGTFRASLLLLLCLLLRCCLVAASLVPACSFCGGSVAVISKGSGEGDASAATSATHHLKPVTRGSALLICQEEATQVREPGERKHERRVSDSTRERGTVRLAPSKVRTGAGQL